MSPANAGIEIEINTMAVKTKHLNRFIFLDPLVWKLSVNRL